MAVYYSYKGKDGVISINVHRGKWMDEVPNSDPVPTLDHVYVLMLMELGPPNMRWLLSPGDNPETPVGKIHVLRDQFGLTYTPRELILQFINWYERNGKTGRTRTT